MGPGQRMVVWISAKIWLAMDKWPGEASVRLERTFPWRLLRLQGLRKSDQILGFYVNGPTAWAINVRYQKERDGHRDR